MSCAICVNMYNAKATLLIFQQQDAHQPVRMEEYVTQITSVIVVLVGEETNVKLVNTQKGLQVM